jgi:hypothetical protein
VFIPLGRFRSLCAEEPAFLSEFRLHRALRTDAAVLLGNTEKTPAGGTEEQFLFRLCTPGVGRAAGAGAEGFVLRYGLLHLGRRHSDHRKDRFFEFIHGFTFSPEGVRSSVPSLTYHRRLGSGGRLLHHSFCNPSSRLCDPAGPEILSRWQSFLLLLSWPFSGGFPARRF